MERYKISANSREKPGDLLFLCGPHEAYEQIANLADSRFRARELTESGTKNWTHVLEFPAGVGPDVRQLLGILTEVLSIPCPEFVDIAIALDWYTVPGGEDLVHTEMGDCINWTKHATHPEWSNSRRARQRMVGGLSEFISSHPLYSSAETIIAAPGHLGDGESFGEILAREVARRVGIKFVESRSDGPRPAQKEVKQDLSHSFEVDLALWGTVIVIDDVYQSGGSARGAGAAARRAGANSVFSLAVARTISN
ncbi:hypothetical protein [Cryobacterium sp. SO1]|uniref:hypothetical protein n=1 Tax=Cryobacterium sp. SO1 TaxID=1897061 RepID=UPI00102366F9|nr:hypothetical protein [Cryobacterium sp. SO1]RZI34553.1 hypothetical protein BJQ95_03011 [Cryobacterium sp. SO1]